jgi:hypothetical protein
MVWKDRIILVGWALAVEPDTNKAPTKIKTASPIIKAKLLVFLTIFPTPLFFDVALEWAIYISFSKRNDLSR